MNELISANKMDSHLTNDVDNCKISKNIHWIQYLFDNPIELISLYADLQIILDNCKLENPEAFENQDNLKDLTSCFLNYFIKTKIEDHVIDQWMWFFNLIHAVMQESSTDEDNKIKKRWSDIGSPESSSKPIKTKDLLSFMNMSTANLTGSNVNDTPTNSDIDSSDEMETRKRSGSASSNGSINSKANPSEFTLSGPITKQGKIKSLIATSIDNDGKPIPKPIMRKKSVMFDEDTAKFGKHEVIKPTQQPPKKKEDVSQLLNYLNFA